MESAGPSHRRSQSSGRVQVQLIEREDSKRYEIAPIEDPLTFEKGFLAIIRACQLLSQKNDGVILVGLAGLSGAGKSFFAEKILNLMPSIAIINMEDYTDTSRLINPTFDDSRLTDYGALLDNIDGLKKGKSVPVPIYDFKSRSRTGYRTLEVPSSRIVILKGIYALSEKLRPFLDLRVSVTGGVNFNLVKRVFRDTLRPGQNPDELFHRIFDTVYPLYESLNEPDLKTAHINIQNNFDSICGFDNATYILKSNKALTPEQVKAALSEDDFKECTEETYDIYLLPPGVDPQECHLFLRVRKRDEKYTLIFEDWVSDPPMVISPRITFEINVRLLGGLIILGYNVAAILERESHVFDDDKVIVKIDSCKQLKGTYVQVRGRDRQLVENVANQLGFEGSYVSDTYIEQMQLERRVGDNVALPADLQRQLCIIPKPRDELSRAYADARMRMKYRQRMIDRRAPVSPATLPDEDFVSSEEISTLNARMDTLKSLIEELSSRIPNKIGASSSSQFGRESPLMEEILLAADGHRQMMLKIDKLSNLVEQQSVGETSRIEGGVDSNRTNSTTQNPRTSTVPALLAFAIACLGMFAYSRHK